MSALWPEDLFRGERVRLAAPLLEDREALARWSNDPDYMRRLDDDPIAPQPPDSFLRPGKESEDSFLFHLRTVPEDYLIGFVALFNVKYGNQSAVMAIGIGDPEYRGRGYGSEAMRLIINYAFRELNLYRISLSVLDYNPRAVHVYEKVGFVREGTSRQAVCRDGQRFDAIHMGLLRSEWKR